MNRQYSIRDLSQEFDVTTRTLRFYEEKGILAPLRNGQNRVYSTADRTHLILVLRGKQLGMSLGEIAELISMYDPDTNNRKQMELLIEKIIERRHQLESQKEELEHMIVDLKAWEQRSRRAMKGKNKTRRES
ncbi:MAG: MerR family DNA-binding transcriptional regulator [Gammaproteobacteria bacterium]|jgi:DNA-binding transcriptional MerR regulator|nr:MerR family DNA-binding transcriptional regulator [Gammaproteobacteria bacterium]|tara:strand:- start:115 stop:510 length:396 start_codon:yes stop_codon:yes gene_type:complete